MNRKYRFQSLLPLWRNVIFVDWHGVLSNQLFWESILSNQSHRVYHKLKTKSEKLFRGNKELVRDWMRGEIESKEILEFMELNFNQTYNCEYFYRKLNTDCRRMTYDHELIQFLQEFRNDYLIVLATDNMECFYHNLNDIGGLVRSFDYVLCSSELGVLKSDSVVKFFGPWLNSHELDFKNAVLIDDSEETCRAFQNAGGISFAFKNIEKLKFEFSKIAI